MAVALWAPVTPRRDMLHQLVERSKRSSGIQIPIGFVRAQGYTARPPLARMLRDGSGNRGGRGGAVRLKLYLCLNLLAAHAPYNIRQVPNRAWAETLALPDPEALGARRIGDALVWLDEAQMISLQRQRGTAPVVTLLDPTGTGHKYARYNRYVRVPLGFWREQWITHLSGAAVALLIILLDLQGARNLRGTHGSQRTSGTVTGSRTTHGQGQAKSLKNMVSLKLAASRKDEILISAACATTTGSIRDKLNAPDLDYPLNSLNI